MATEWQALPSQAYTSHTEVRSTVAAQTNFTRAIPLDEFASNVFGTARKVSGCHHELSKTHDVEHAVVATTPSATL